jgi:phospholipid/cholesterol/gamma-HCH transport system permease protein
MRTFISDLGSFGHLGYQVAVQLRHVWKDRKRLLVQMDHVGVNSIPLVMLVGFFAGAIIAWQAAYQFRGMVSLDVMGGQASRVIVMEMGPVLTALVIAGRIGASMTAEIGTMKVTEQIDALRTMAIDPVRYIVMPRVVGLSVMMPVLTLFSNLVGVFGCLIVSGYFLDITPQSFFESIRTTFLVSDLYGGLLKSCLFGVLIAWIGCFMGLGTTGGAKGVGKATISSFVLAAILILVGDFFLWLILF